MRKRFYLVSCALFILFAFCVSAQAQEDSFLLGMRGIVVNQEQFLSLYITPVKWRAGPRDIEIIIEDDDLDFGPGHKGVEAIGHNRFRVTFDTSYTFAQILTTVENIDP